jgi:hypothetical protein
MITIPLQSNKKEENQRKIPHREDRMGVNFIQD